MPSGFLKFTSFLLHTANTRGRIKQAEEIAQAGIKCIQNSSSIPVEAMADFHNNRLVSLHNRYQFAKDKDSEKLAKILEKRYLTGVDLGSHIDPLFGRFCGTMAQHYGFMGPSYLDYFRKWNSKARQCFGENLDRSGQYRLEWLRQHNYAVYAYLDAGMPLEAGEVLFTYLGVKFGQREYLHTTPENIEFFKFSTLKDSSIKKLFLTVLQDIESFTPWQHGVLCRFFADTKEQEMGTLYLKTALFGINKILTTSHPWQLWYCNAGKIAMLSRQPELAFDLFQKSLKICLDKKMGPTIQVMALMPIYELFCFNNICKTDTTSLQNVSENIETKIKKAAKCLDSAHFDLLNQSQTLQELFQNKDFSIKAFFPFTFS